MKNIRLVVFLIILTSCGNGNFSDDEGVSMNQEKRPMIDVESDVIRGYTNAYMELYIVYLDCDPSSILYWALFMADKQDYPPAYLHVFYSLVDAYVGNVEDLHKMDKRTQNLALEYLNLASQKGEKQADEILLQLKSKGF